MKKISQKIIIPAALIAAIGGGVIAAKPVLAGYSEERHNSMVQRLVETFGLNEAEVEAVFAEARQEQQQERQAAFIAQLDKAVANGELTSAQKELILVKHEEMRANKDSKSTDWHELSPEERRDQMQAKRAELETWATENGVDLKYFGQHQGEGKGPRGEMKGSGPRNGLAE